MIMALICLMQSLCLMLRRLACSLTSGDYYGKCVICGLCCWVLRVCVCMCPPPPHPTPPVCGEGGQGLGVRASSPSFLYDSTNTTEPTTNQNTSSSFLLPKQTCSIYQAMEITGTGFMDALICWELSSLVGTKKSLV